MLDSTAGSPNFLVFFLVWVGHIRVGFQQVVPNFIIFDFLVWIHRSCPKILRKILPRFASTFVVCFCDQDPSWGGSSKIVQIGKARYGLPRNICGVAKTVCGRFRQGSNEVLGRLDFVVGRKSFLKYFQQNQF